MSRRIFIGLLLTIASLSGYAQSKIEVIGRAQEDRILLRWAPSDAIAWQYGLKYGYTVERYTITRDSALVRPPVRITLNPLPLLPNPMAEWEAFVDENDYAAVAAQAIFGETFELTEDYSTDITQIVQKTKEQEQRFSFTLFAADQSFKVAEMSALGLIDNNAQKNEKYMYKVISNVPDTIHSIQEGTLFIGLVDNVPLPEPTDVAGEFGDRMVMLRWNRVYFERIYNSFIIERSDDDGKTFKALNKEPLINTYEGDNPDAENFYKIDSLPENNKVYHYRVKGITPFGEIGPPSEPITGFGYGAIDAQVAINAHEVRNNQQVMVKWDFPADKEDLIKGFIVQKAYEINGLYENVHKDTIRAEKRSLLDFSPYSTNYYRVGFVNNDLIQFSHPYLVQLEDSIPPAVPIGLSHTIDTTGVVDIQWTENTEKDLLGYRIYRSNFKNSEFVQITSKPVLINAFVDSISLNTLTKSIYYQVSAIDKRFNESARSELIEVSKPDKIPPVPPVFKNYEIRNDSLILEWVKSSSEDVSKYYLYSNDFKSSDWTLESELIASTDSYVMPLMSSGRYRFGLIAIDQAGNESTLAKPVSVDVVLNKATGVFKDIKARADRKNKQIVLTWDFQSTEKPVEYLIYRASREEKLALYKRLESVAKSYTDTELTMNEDYRYVVFANYSNGARVISKEVEVKY